jgi:hypothetical protein
MACSQHRLPEADQAGDPTIYVNPLLAKAPCRWLKHSVIITIPRLYHSDGNTPHTVHVTAITNTTMRPARSEAVEFQSGKFIPICEICDMMCL